MLRLSPKAHLQSYDDTAPVFDVRHYLEGPIKAWGFIQDWRKRVVTRFDIQMHGTWEGNTCTLSEHFDFYNGKTQDRVWTITQRDDHNFTGHAHDLIGAAKGQSHNSAICWQYTMDVPVDDTTYRLNFEDWMWAMNDGVIINRSYIRKFGITVSELTVFMQKQS